LIKRFDDWLSSGARYRWCCAAALALGCVTYAGAWRTHFYADDVDIFGGMLVASRDGNFWPWMASQANGHISLLSKVAYFAVWRWCSRDVFWWHLATLLVWMAGATLLADLYRRMFQSRAISVILLAVFSCSRAYEEQIIATCSGNHLWSATLAIASLWCAWRFRETHRAGHLGLAALSGMLSYLCVATGALTFVYLVAAAWIWRREMPAAACWSLAVAGLAGAAAVCIIQRRLGGPQSEPNVLFGLRETAYGLGMLSGRLCAPSIVSRLLSAGIVALCVWQRRRLNREVVLLALVYLLLPLLFATSFRSEFPGIHQATRYYLLPLFAATLLVGQALVLLSSLDFPPWLTSRRLVAATIVLLSFSVARTTWRNLHAGVVADDLHTLEVQIGNLVAEYARARPDEPIYVPQRIIDLPVSPGQRPLDFVARYAVPAPLAQRVVGVPENRDFDRFVERRAPGLCEALGVPVLR
jgi:hypothetical protein